MDLIEEMYLGWQPLTHAIDCTSPVWDVAEVRHDTGGRILPTGAEAHTCATDGCTHTATFARVQLRLLCRSCHTVYVLAGEDLGVRHTTTAVTGWGQSPRQLAGLWLWPGQPADHRHQPHQYLVTREPSQVTRATLYGLITRYRDATGTPRWIAAAVPDENGEHQLHTLRWRYRSAGLADLPEAADWIASVESLPQRALEVAV
ncbi:hypothetical protein [Streptomyces griseosporeus]|uniref:hypothetical protein n=1 Tax=Streptomyces griseosporeus TaxID=1910 RepID=UPI003700B825